MTNGAYSKNDLSNCLYSVSFFIVDSNTKRSFFNSSIVTPLPSRRSWICNCSFSVCKSDISLSIFSIDFLISSMSDWIWLWSSVNLVIFDWRFTSSERFRKRSLTFSKFCLRSSYFRTPRTSLYAEHNFFFSATELVSASETICSESKKKKRAISLFNMKSLMKMSGPISFVSSLIDPSIFISTNSFSVIISYPRLTVSEEHEMEGITTSENSIST